MNTPNERHESFNPDDPRLTAFALGELESADEIAEIESLIESDLEAQRHVNAIRATAAALRSELEREPAPSLTTAQRAAIESALVDELVNNSETAHAGECDEADRDQEPIVVVGGIGLWRSADFWIGAGLSGLAATLVVGVIAPGFFNRVGATRMIAASDEESLAPGGDVTESDTAMSDSTRSGRRERAATTHRGGMTDPLESYERAGEGRAQSVKPAAPPADTQASRGIAVDSLGRANQSPVAAKDLAESAPSADDAGLARDEAGADADNKEAFAGLRFLSTVGTSGGERARSAGRGYEGGRSAGGYETGEQDHDQFWWSQAGEVTAKSAHERAEVMLDSMRGIAPADRSAVIVGGELVIPDDPWHRAEQFNTEQYARINDNPFEFAADSPLSTFSIDVDTASYSNIRRFLNEQGTLPPPDAVRIEELVNYFSYDYAPPATVDAADLLDEDGVDEAPFNAHIEVGPAPWNMEHRLVRIGLKGMEVDMSNRPAANLVFLIDVSGSMNAPNKLPLVKESMRSLVESLGVDDQVAIVTYAGASRVALESTPVHNRDEILAAIESLEPGGSTNGAGGIIGAYRVAQENFIEDGINRVILATDGDFNVGVTDNGQLTRLIEEKAQSDVFLSILGFGMGNLKDDRLEELSNRGNGNYAYIDNYDEAHRALVEQMGGTLITIAKDVKIQVEFNPAEVASYRLIGYENRMLAARDFNDDTKDAGEIGAGHDVTALYEIVPVANGDGVHEEAAATAVEPEEVDPLRYQTPQRLTEQATTSGELLTLKVRYKTPQSDTSSLIEFPVVDDGRGLDAVSDDFRLAAGVAEFGMLLRRSPHRGAASYEQVIELTKAAITNDAGASRRRASADDGAEHDGEAARVSDTSETVRRAELLLLVERAMRLEAIAGAKGAGEPEGD